ncbi:hypothetical protein LX32DRAFT_72849 [Colletotrichum zoysiae]|uniref:Uncharacterized protein n=1 Tax=Colletotrichum zoysiae TaxID=1216348 RepID=A0AAD9LXT7_9PEZI|nr:hypothetical protein LX32DRAFT_72849 [Colletotrichum zoysiae]
MCFSFSSNCDLLSPTYLPGTWVLDCLGPSLPCLHRHLGGRLPTYCIFLRPDEPNLPPGGSHGRFPPAAPRSPRLTPAYSLPSVPRKRVRL